jgi:hypothetical protein
MEITVEDILRLPSAVDWKLVAGKEGTRKRVRWYLCMISQLIGPWVHGREILFLYENSNIEMNESSLLHLLEQSNENEISAVVFIMNSSNALPQAVLDEANRINMPLIVMPNEIPMVDVSKEIADLIIIGKRSRNETGAILKNILLGHISDKDKYITMLANNDRIGHSKIHRIIIVSYETSQLRTLDFDAVLISNELHAAFGDVIYFTNRGKIIILCSGNSNYFIGLKEKCEYFYSIIKSNPNLTIKGIGIGKRVEDLYSFEQSYKTAKDVLRFSERSNIKIGDYETIGSIKKILFNVEDSSILYSCFHGTMDVLTSYDKEHSTDLFTTLQVYLENNGNIKQSADALFIHKNTMNYRINKIREIMNSDLSNMVELKIQMECYNMYIVLKKQKKHI